MSFAFVRHKNNFNNISKEDRTTEDVECVIFFNNNFYICHGKNNPQPRRWIRKKLIYTCQRSRKSSRNWKPPEMAVFFLERRKRHVTMYCFLFFSYLVLLKDEEELLREQKAQKPTRFCEDNFVRVLE